MQSVIAESTITEIINDKTTAVVAVNEPELVAEISQLWATHMQAHTAVKKTRDELKLIRANLALRLHELKSVLSRPGRGGAWSSFLNSERIPRSTADRLVRCHAKTLAGDEDSCTTEQICEPTEATVRRYFHGLWPRLSRVLTSPEAVEIFIADLRSEILRCGKPRIQFTVR